MSAGKEETAPALKWEFDGGRRQSRLGGPAIEISGCAIFVNLEPPLPPDVGKDPGCPNSLLW